MNPAVSRFLQMIKTDGRSTRRLGTDAGAPPIPPPSGKTVQSGDWHPVSGIFTNSEVVTIGRAGGRRGSGHCFDLLDKFEGFRFEFSACGS